MLRSSTTQGADHLLLGTSERTVFRTAGPAGAEVRKLLLRGSLADAEREVALGRALAGLDVVRYLGAEIDPSTNRPCVRTEWLPGRDLGAAVADGGAMRAADACRALAPAARTLAAMHALRSVQAPYGLCHGDVKPSNLLRIGDRTVLIDFEHAAACGAGAAVGTRAFAAPEAGPHVPLQPSFDVHALGATLRWLLAGGARGDHSLALQDPEVALLVSACTAPAAADRPPAAVVAAALEDLAGRLAAPHPAEDALDRLLAGDLAGCRERLAGTAIEPGRARTLHRAVERAERLWLRRATWLAATLRELPEEPAPGELAERLRQLDGLLRRVPRHQAAVRLRRAAVQAAAGRLAALLPRVSDLVRDEDFAAARTLLRDLQRMTAAALATPLPFRVPNEEDPRLPSLLQRAPLQCLRQEEQRLETAIGEHERMAADATAAEAALAFDAAEAAIDRIAARHGGTSPAVARRRDRLHRLVFYVERIGGARRNVELLRDLLPALEVGALLRLCSDCARAAAGSRSGEEGGHGTMGLRNLQYALHNLAEEYPALASRTAPALAELEAGLAAATDECRRLLADSAQRLRAEPVPVRPLQTILGRLDTFRALESVVDRAGAPRSEVVDGIESLRLRLEQARATRDRLARGAEQALARGHWTTGLFDMERAAGLPADDEQGHATERLQQRLAEARRRKQEIETAQRRNVELQTRYATLQDDGSSTFAMRLQALGERHDCLQFLILHAPKERGGLYARDLREVEILIALERSAQAQVEFDREPRPSRRVEIARAATVLLDELAAGFDPTGELPGRLQRQIEHWRTLLAAAERTDAERSHAARASRRRRLTTSAAGVVLCVVAALFGAEFLARESHAEPKAAAPDAATLASDPAGALAALDRDAGGTPARANAAAAARALAEAAAAGAPAELQRAHDRLVAALLQPSLDAPFALACWHTGAVLAGLRCDAEQLRVLRDAVQDAAARLRDRGVEPPPEPQRRADR